MAQDLARRGVESKYIPASLAVARKPEERIIDIGRCDVSLLADLIHPLTQHSADELNALREIVSARGLRPGDHVTFLVEEA
jgi:hypothetical protein